MNKHIVILCALLLSSHASAQTIKVIKTSGKKAVVQFEGASPKVGRTFSISEAKAADDEFSLDEDAGGRRGSGARDRTLGAAFDITTSSAGDSSIMNVFAQGLYGWVSSGGVFEYGPQIGFGMDSVKIAGTSTSTMKVAGGVFLDYNIVPNRLGTDFVWGLTGSAKYGMSKPSSGEGSSTIDGSGGGVLKWFFSSSSPTALRVTAEYAYQRTSTSGQSGSGSGFHISGGLQSYF